MIEINLLPQEFRGKQKKEVSGPGLPSRKVIIAFLAVLIAVEGLLGALVFVRKGGLGGLTAERKKLEPAARRIQTVKAETARLQARSLELEKAMYRRIRWAQLLNAVSDGMTDEVWLTKIWLKREVKVIAGKTAPRKLKAKDRLEKTESEKKQEDTGRSVTKYVMVLNGTVSPRADSTAAVGKFITSLELNPVIQSLFSKVWLEKIDREVEDDVERFDFTVSCLFSKEFGGEFDGVF